MLKILLPAKKYRKMKMYQPTIHLDTSNVLKTGPSWRAGRLDRESVPMFGLIGLLNQFQWD